MTLNQPIRKTRAGVDIGLTSGSVVRESRLRRVAEHAAHSECIPRLRPDVKATYAFWGFVLLAVGLKRRLR